jgi:hypothetical protein
MRRSILLLAALAATLAGCGADRRQPPDVVTPQTPKGGQAVRVAPAGVSFTAPGNWRVSYGPAPLYATVTSGRATIAIYRYPRVEKLPRTTKQLAAAGSAHASAGLTRDPTLTELVGVRVRIDGEPGFQTRATEHILGLPRTVRSTHLYAHRGELVIDAFAPAEDFARVDAGAFRPLLRSLRVSRPAGGA